MEQIRLQKYLAEAGIASRRKCEEYILQGRVKVNNEIGSSKNLFFTILSINYSNKSGQ